MKRILAVAVSATMCISTTQMASAKKKSLIQGKSAYQIIRLLAKSGFAYDPSDIIRYTRKTDPNRMLGRKGYYITKAQCYDFSLDQDDTESDPLGVNVETFKNAVLAKKRYKYLTAMSDPSLGVFGTNEYIIQDKKIIFRFTNEYTSKQIKTFKKAIKTYDNGKMYKYKFQ